MRIAYICVSQNESGQISEAIISLSIGSLGQIMYGIYINILTFISVRPFMFSFMFSFAILSFCHTLEVYYVNSSKLLNGTNKSCCICSLGEKNIFGIITLGFHAPKPPQYIHKARVDIYKLYVHFANLVSGF